jgi:hypothetical protein
MRGHPFEGEFFDENAVENRVLLTIPGEALNALNLETEALQNIAADRVVARAASADPRASELACGIPDRKMSWRDEWVSVRPRSPILKMIVDVHWSAEFLQCGRPSKPPASRSTRTGGSGCGRGNEHVLA